MEEQTVVRALAALAQPLRLRAFRALIVVGQEGMTPSTMAEGLGVAQNALSFHLKELTHAGLVTQERAGRSIIYRANYGQMSAVMDYMIENCCAGAVRGVGSPASS